jgi:DNA-binding HxlR family transcriptional regulator
MGEQPGRMEEPVSNVLDAIRGDARVLIVEELERRNPALLAELRAADEPTSDQSDGVVLGVLAPALRELRSRVCAERVWASR